MITAKITYHSGTNREESENFDFVNLKALKAFLIQNGFHYADHGDGRLIYENGQNERLMVGEGV